MLLSSLQLLFFVFLFLLAIPAAKDKVTPTPATPPPPLPLSPPKAAARALEVVAGVLSRGFARLKAGLLATCPGFGPARRLCTSTKFEKTMVLQLVEKGLHPV